MGISGSNCPDSDPILQKELGSRSDVIKLRPPILFVNIKELIYFHVFYTLLINPEFVMTKAVSNRDICFIKAMISLCEHGNFLLNFASHTLSCPHPPNNIFRVNIWYCLIQDDCVPSRISMLVLVFHYKVLYVREVLSNCSFWGY